MGFLDKLTGTVRPDSGTAPRSVEDVRAMILGLNGPDVPYVVRDSTPDEKADLVAEWRVWEPAWRSFFARTRISRAVQIRMRFVPADHEVRTVDHQWEIKWVEGTPVAVTDSFPAGFAPEAFLNPTGDGNATLRITPAFSEGGAAAYVVPEIWVNFDRIWVQPWYVLATAYDDSGPTRLRDADGNNYPPVFDVSPRSLFYNQFWVLFYAVVPEESPIDHYTSAEKLFNEHRAIYQALVDRDPETARVAAASKRRKA